MELTANHIERYQGRLSETIDDAIRDMGPVRFTKDDPQHLLAACLYATIIESARECRELLKAPSVTTVGTIIRSILESYADLCAVLKDPKYVERMIATFHVQQMVLLQNMQRAPDNPYHADLARQVNIDAEMAAVAANIKVYVDRGNKPLKQYERFNCAGPEVAQLYSSYYWNLCLESHNNVATLESRHIEKTPDDFNVVLFKHNRRSQLVTYLDSLLSILIDASLRLHTFVETGLAPSYDAKVRELQEFRTAIWAEVNAKAPGA